MPEHQRRLLGRSDVFVGQKGVGPASASPTATLTAPRSVTLPVVEKEGQSYVEIRDRRSRRLVTVIELLSPSNKQPGPDRDQCEYKRAEVLASPTHLVEIDLLRGGKRMPFEEEIPCDYCVLVSRVSQRPRAGLWTIGLRDRLPPVPVPLAGDDPEPVLDVQAILHHLYDAGGYAKFIYDAEPVPPLSNEDAAWARSLIPAGTQSTG
jgi:hypothetical protein